MSGFWVFGFLQYDAEHAEHCECCDTQGQQQVVVEFFLHIPLIQHCKGSENRLYGKIIFLIFVILPTFCNFVALKSKSAEGFKK